MVEAPASLDQMLAVVESPVHNSSGWGLRVASLGGVYGDRRCGGSLMLVHAMSLVDTLYTVQSVRA